MKGAPITSTQTASAQAPATPSSVMSLMTVKAKGDHHPKNLVILFDLCGEKNFRARIGANGYAVHMDATTARKLQLSDWVESVTPYTDVLTELPAIRKQLNPAARQFNGWSAKDQEVYEAQPRATVNHLTMTAAELVEAASANEVSAQVVLDFDETLGIKKYKLWMSGARRRGQDEIGEALVFVSNISKLQTAPNPVVVITRRNQSGVMEIEKAMREMKIDKIMVLSSIDAKGDARSKGEVLLEAWPVIMEMRNVEATTLIYGDDDETGRKEVEGVVDKLLHVQSANIVAVNLWTDCIQETVETYGEEMRQEWETEYLDHLNNT